MTTNAENNPLLSPFGSPIGILFGQESRVEELNQRIMERKFPDIDFQPNFSPRPVMTKYTLLPIVDQRQTPTVPIQSYLDYYPEVMFYPGNSRAPIQGYFNRVSLENDLRNQTRPLVSSDDAEKQYIPSLNSDLYNVVVPCKHPVEQPYPSLFSKIKVESSATNLEGTSVGASYFNNNTRIQVRDLSR
jgi:hypothetical protein